MAFSTSITNEIHVLLVEHDNKDHDKTKNMLEYFSYKVTAVRLASTAISVLSKGKSLIDLVITNMNSPDSYGLELLQDAVKMNLLVILMSDEDDANTIMWALEHGAFLCIKKPVTIQTIGYLWQHVLREKAIRFKENEWYKMVMENNGLNNEFGGDLMEYSMHDKNNVDGEEKSNKKGMDLRIVSKDEEINLQNHGNVTYKRKVWTEWTQELHDKFMNAITELGEGRCYPKEILELMGVPGLTRMQVASHLQRCRGGNWLPPNERKSKVVNAETASTRKKAPRAKQMRFGCMPCSSNISMSHLSIQDYQNTCHQEVIIDSSIQNNMLVDNLDGSSNKVYQPQFLVQPQNYNGYPFAHENENVGQIDPTLGMDSSWSIDEPYLFGAQNVASNTNTTPNHQQDNTKDDFEFSYMDCFFALEQELQVDYNGSLRALMLDQEYHNQTPSVTNASTNRWSQKSPKPGNGKESDGNMRED